MQMILSTNVEDGGAANEFTVYQLVVEPSTKTLWAKTSDDLTWERINLTSFFK